MKIYDISQNIFGCTVYPGDSAPVKKEDKRISKGDLYNLTSFEMCAHNGTHIDAPFHFSADGDTVDGIPLEKTVGHCYVTLQNGDIGRSEAERLLLDAKKAGNGCEKRILIKGKGTVTRDAALVFAEADIYLVGVEGQSVGPEKAPMEIHKLLLNKKVVLLEGIRLNDVKEGAYFLSAAPLLLNGCDGAPCRAVLLLDER